MTTAVIRRNLRRQLILAREIRDLGYDDQAADCFNPDLAPREIAIRAGELASLIQDLAGIRR